MKNVMKKAWEIARKGQEMYGGRVKEYFAEALRIAWAITKRSARKAQLVGTPKQVSWAESIRKEIVDNIEYILELKARFKSTKDIEVLEECILAYNKVSDVQFFIDRRNYRLRFTHKEFITALKNDLTIIEGIN